MARKILALFFPYRLRVLLLLLTVLLIAVPGGAVTPEVTRLMIDLAFPRKDLTLLVLLLAVLCAQTMLTGLISIGQSYLHITLNQFIVRDMRIRLYKHLQAVSLRFYTSERTGEILSRLTHDVDGVKDVVIGTATTMARELVTVLTTLIVMLTLNIPLTLLSLGMTPIFIYLSLRVGKVMRQVSKRTQEVQADVVSRLEETLNVSGALLIRSFGSQRAEIERVEAAQNQLVRTQIRQGMLGRWFLLSLHCFFNGMPVLVYYLGGRQVIGGRLSLGALVAFVALQYQLFPSLRQLLSLPLDIQAALALFERLFAYLALPVEIRNRPDAQTPEAGAGHIHFRRVSFGYEPDRLVVRGIDFEIRPGQLVALVGPSGAGKTTLTYLLRRLYDVGQGAVEIDGHDVRSISLESLSEQIGLVTQDVYLLNTSVFVNIAYARPQSTLEEVIAAAQAAQMHERIMELPQGYDTLVGPRGYTLSGGEKQRIAIARALLKNPRILILDEATSALDTRSEGLIQQALLNARKNRTTLAIAHRLSTIQAADLILVLDQGRIIERGTHSELLRHNSLYAQLYRT